MINLFSYQTLLKSIVYIVLIGQLWTGVASYCSWGIDLESELIELINLEDSEPIEEENKNEKDDKLKNDLSTSKFDTSPISVKISHSEKFPPIQHLEPISPPPDPFLS